MKKIDVSQIVDPSIQQPFTGLSLDFLQDGNKQMVYAICQNIIKSHGHMYSTSVPYLVSATAGTSFTSDGVVFFGGELYIMRENTSGFDYAIVDTTPDAVADPVLFTDAVSRNVHNNRYLTFQPGSSGALFDINNIINVTGAQTITTVTIGSGGAPAFQNSWSATTPVRYRKNIDGLLSIDGVATKSTTSSGVIFTLPTGYLPSTDKYIPCYLIQLGSIVHDFLIFRTSGNVELNSAPSATNTHLYLNGINFYLA